MSATDATAQVVLVDADDQEIGVAPKLAAHEHPGLLHRALSAFVFNRNDELLLQRRAAAKYHFSGLWSNSCCTHPRPGEPVATAARRRLLEELGVHCELQAVGTFTYQATDPRSGLTEHELDHVVIGRCDDTPRPDPDEVDEVRWTSLEVVRAELARTPDRFTPWFARALEVAVPAARLRGGTGATPPSRPHDAEEAS